MFAKKEKKILTSSKFISNFLGPLVVLNAVFAVLVGIVVLFFQQTFWSSYPSTVTGIYIMLIVLTLLNIGGSFVAFYFSSLLSVKYIFSYATLKEGEADNVYKKLIVIYAIAILFNVYSAYNSFSAELSNDGDLVKYKFILESMGEGLVYQKILSQLSLLFYILLGMTTIASLVTIIYVFKKTKGWILKYDQKPQSPQTPMMNQGTYAQPAVVQGDQEMQIVQSPGPAYMSAPTSVNSQNNAYGFSPLQNLPDLSNLQAQPNLSTQPVQSTQPNLGRLPDLPPVQTHLETAQPFATAPISSPPPASDLPPLPPIT